MTNSNFPNDLLEILLKYQALEAQSTAHILPLRNSGLLWDLIRYLVSNDRVQTWTKETLEHGAGLWRSSVMECLPSITEALNSMPSALRRRGKRGTGMLHQWSHKNWACRVSRSFLGIGAEVKRHCKQKAHGVKTTANSHLEAQGVQRGKNSSLC